MSDNHLTPKPLMPKWACILKYLLDVKLNRFEAEKSPYHDHVLPSTVAILQAKGVKVARKSERVRDFTGGLTTVKRYWIEKNEANLAVTTKLLNKFMGAGDGKGAV